MSKKTQTKLKAVAKSLFVVGEAVLVKKSKATGMVTYAEVQAESGIITYHVLLENGETRHFAEKDLEAE